MYTLLYIAKGQSTILYRGNVDFLIRMIPKNYSYAEIRNEDGDLEYQSARLEKFADVRHG